MAEKLDREDRQRLAEEERWLSVDEVAERLRVDAETVHAWLREGRLPGEDDRTSGGPRVRSSDLEEFLLGQR